MNIDNLDFDDEDKLDASILSVCFPICCVSESNGIVDSGTGFIINNNGVFLSAGHVFENGMNNYKVYYKENEYKVEAIYKEHDKDKGEDLFIGKLVEIGRAHV